MNIRSIKRSDFSTISAVLNDWWGGRQMADMLPKLFFDHFSNTSFIAQKDGEMIGFLVGFLSQSNPDEAYIHFAGVHPEYRKQGIGHMLYRSFFQTVQDFDRSFVRCITSPVNQGSIAYHTKMGFEIVPGNNMMEGIPVHSDYDGIGKDRVLFIKKLS